MNLATAGQWFARFLAVRKVDHVFFIDAILRETLIEMEQVGIKRVLTHSEKAAAYMADGYGRIKGTPGVCFAQSVGAANLAAGLQDAFLGQSPVLAVTGRKPLSYAKRNAYQEIDHQPMFSAVTKFSGDVNEASELPRILSQAWRTALDVAPGPVHIDLDGLNGDRIEKAPLASSLDTTPAGDTPRHRTAPSRSEIAAGLRRLTEATRVVIVAGTGAALSSAGEEILMLAERLQAPVACSLGAYGLVPTRHPLFIGTVGNYSAPPANEIVAAAEVVLFVGCRTGDQVTLDWQIPLIATPVVHIDAEALELGRNYPDTIAIHADPKLALRAMIELQAEGTQRQAAYTEWAAALVGAWRERMAQIDLLDPPAIRVERLCHEIGKALPEDGILVADTGYSAIWTCTCIDFNGKGQTYLRAAGSLGWAFPAAMGAKCAAGDRVVVCFTGDGGFYYHLAELETARRCNIPVVVVVNNNSGFGQSIVGIRNLQGDRPGNPDEIGMFREVNFARLAEEFGVRGIRVERSGDIASALREAIALNEPVVVDVVTDVEPRAPTPWKPA